MNSSDDDDIIETESSTDNESYLNRVNQSEAEDGNDSISFLNDTSENEAKELEQENSRGQEKANKFAEGGVATSSTPTEYREKNGKPQNAKKAAEKNFQNQKKNNRKLVAKQKLLTKRLIVIQRHPKLLHDLATD